MGTPFLGELRLMSFNFPPKSWAMCNGQFLPINQNQPLFALLGTMYGGNGQTTFALPDLRGRVPIHIGSGFIQGQAGGQAAHTVTQSEMPAHSHFMNVSNADPDPVNGALPTNSFFSKAPNLAYSQQTDQLTTWIPATITNVGGSQPHENRQPYTVLNWCIALQGIFPSRN